MSIIVNVVATGSDWAKITRTDGTTQIVQPGAEISMGLNEIGDIATVEQVASQTDNPAFSG